MLIAVIVCSLVGGVFSLIGGIILTYTKKGHNFAVYATAFAAGSLLSASFLDLLPEAVEEVVEAGGEAHGIFLYALFGLIFFFLLESTLRWFHRHSHDEHRHNKLSYNHEQDNAATHPVVPMIILGDTIHNFLDGVIIASGFLVSLPTGIIVTLAVVTHEIPQEIGDFGIMIHQGIKKGKVILFNFLSALASTFSAVIFFLIGEEMNFSLAPLTAIVAGFFIYIATTDIIPSIHQSENKKETWKKIICLLLGVLVIGILILKLHWFIEEIIAVK